MKTQEANLTRSDILGNGNCSSDQEILNSILKKWRHRLGYWSIFAAVPAMLASHVAEARSDKAKKSEMIVTGEGTRLSEKLRISCSDPKLLKRQSQFLLPHQKGS